MFSLIRRAAPALGRFHSLSSDDRTCHARAQEGHEHVCRLLLGRCWKSESAVDDLALQLGRERPDDVDPADRKELAELMDAEFSVTTRDHRADQLSRLGRHELRPDLPGYP